MTSSPLAANIDDGEPGGRGYRVGRWKSRVNGHPEINGEFPAASLADEMETPGQGQLRAALTVMPRIPSALIRTASDSIRLSASWISTSPSTST